MRRSLMQENGSRTLELERHADRSTPELEAAQAETGDVVAAPIKGSEVADVPADADVLSEESHHSAADVEPEIVLACHVEEAPDVLNFRPDRSDAAEPRTGRMEPP